MHNFIQSHSPWSIAAPMIAFLLLGIKLASMPLLKRHATYIRSVWYFYFLLAFATVLIGLLCEKFGVIDAKGEFHGSLGDTINRLLGAVFSLNEDMLAIGGIVGIVLGPQFLSYLFSGVLSNCAAPPRYTGPVIKFALFNLAKSFVVAAGVLLGMAFLSGVSKWLDVTTRQNIGLGLFSIVIVLLAFHVLSMYGEIVNTEEDLRTHPRVNRLQFIHDWMTRNNAPPAERTEDFQPR